MSNVHIKPETKIEFGYILFVKQFYYGHWYDDIESVDSWHAECGDVLWWLRVDICVCGCVEFFIVVPLVQRVAIRFGLMRYIPFMMTACMAGTMTFIAPIIETGHVINLAQYLIAFPRNYVAAFLLQHVLAMPFAVRTLLYIKHIA